ncbi:hypothetical protein P389DRAFT_196654 [Cystobasidium minutum MCA 4210]|uniref:uncharacterized protein n=1 Tax=Cystobasidium minutum MCA 4210 TaxID=1397322 RepID=UPI0034CED40C|eukprot:jgi/Rhomi1/196654/gm1.4868_g
MVNYAVSLEAVSMREAMPVHHIPQAFPITLTYKKREQLLMRPESLSNLRNNIVWTFNLSNRLDPECIQIRYTDEGHSKTVHGEYEWSQLRSHRKITRFTVDILDKPTSTSGSTLSNTGAGNDSGFGTNGSSPAYTSYPSFRKKVKSETNDHSGVTSAVTADCWGETVSGSSTDVWGDSHNDKTGGKPTEFDAWGEESNSTPRPSSNMTSPQASKPSSKKNLWGDEDDDDHFNSIFKDNSDGKTPPTSAFDSGSAAACSKNPWGDDDEDTTTPSTTSVPTAQNSAWGDGPSDMHAATRASTVPISALGSTNSENDGWGASTSNHSHSISYGTYNGGRGRGRGRGLGNGRGRAGRGGGRGGGHVNDSTREGSYELSSSDTRGQHDSNGTGGKNQMYQAPDSGWKARNNHRHHPYAPHGQTSFNQQSQAHTSIGGNNDYQGGGPRRSYNYSISQAPPSSATSLQVSSMQVVAPASTFEPYDTQNQAIPTSHWSSSSSNVAGAGHVPRQFSQSQHQANNAPSYDQDAPIQVSVDNAQSNGGIDFWGDSEFIETSDPGKATSSAWD